MSSSYIIVVVVSHVPRSTRLLSGPFSNVQSTDPQFDSGVADRLQRACVHTHLKLSEFRPSAPHSTQTAFCSSPSVGFAGLGTDRRRRPRPILGQLDNSLPPPSPRLVSDSLAINERHQSRPTRNALRCDLLSSVNHSRCSTALHGRRMRHAFAAAVHVGNKTTRCFAGSSRSSSPARRAGRPSKHHTCNPFPRVRSHVVDRTVYRFEILRREAQKTYPRMKSKTRVQSLYVVFTDIKLGSLESNNRRPIQGFATPASATGRMHSRTRRRP
jgi:hypothetical protein